MVNITLLRLAASVTRCWYSTERWDDTSDAIDTRWSVQELAMKSSSRSYMSAAESKPDETMLISVT